MKLDISRITEIDKDLEELDIEEKRTVAEAKAKYGCNFDDWYIHIKDQLRQLESERDKLKEERIIVKATNIDVGDGISLSPYTDWHAYTVIERRETLKGFVLKIQKDNAIRTDKNGMSDSQDYRFERDKNGRIEEVRWSNKKNWFTCDIYKVMLGRYEYYDYSF